MPNTKITNVMFYGEHYSEKPIGYEIAKIQKKLTKTSIGIIDLAESMASGCTFKPAYLNGTKSTDFISQQLFGLDFDKGTSIEEEVDRCRELNIMPVFGYTTFSHKPEHHKFRLVFCNNEIIYDINKRNKLQISLMNAFDKCDESCKDGSRMFFGGRSLIMLEPNNVIDGNSIIEKYYIEENATKVNKKNSNSNKRIEVKKTTEVEHDEHSKEKVKAISELNVQEMRRLLNKTKINASPVVIKPMLDVEKSKHQIQAHLESLQFIEKPKFTISPNLNFNNEKSNAISANLNSILENKKANSYNLCGKPIDEKTKKVLKIFNECIKCYVDRMFSGDAVMALIFLLCFFANVIYPKYKKHRDLGGGDKIANLSITPTKTLKTDISSKKQVFKYKKDLYDYINKEIDLSEYLGIGSGKVCCVLPKHEDTSPSAHTFVMENGVQLYKCFGCGTARTAIAITEHLSGCKRSEAIEFIKAVYDLELIESEWVQEQKQMMIDCANYIDSDELKLEFPELYKSIRTRKNTIKLMLLHFSEMVNEDMQIDGKPFFFASYNTLGQVCGVKKSDRLAQSITLFSLLNLIEKIPEDKIPEKELTKAKAIAAKHGFKKLTNFYSFNEYGVNTFSDSEKKAELLRSNHISLAGLSREWVLRTFDIDEANRIFPQYKYENERGTSKKSDVHTAEIVNSIFLLINEKGYATENEVISLLNTNHTKERTKIQIKRSLQEMLNAYGLDRIRLNKQLKDKYKVSGNGYPFIIVPNDSKEQLIG